MNMNDYPNPPRAPSRAGYRRPTIARTVSSDDLLPEIPSLNTLKSQPIIRFPSSSSSDSDSDEDEDFKPLAIALPSLYPPISPTSSTSSSDLDSPSSSSEEDLHYFSDEPAFDDFPIPPRTQEDYTPPPQQISAPSADIESLPSHPTLFHHGLSRSALATCREFWDRRFRLWHAWRAQVEHVDAVQAEYRREGLRATLRFPDPPVLPRTRTLPSQGANGINHATVVAARRARVQACSPYAPVFPRMGDLAALRDPYGDWPDRAFIYHPTYSISKTLFHHDMLERARARAGGLYAFDSPASAYSQDDASTQQESGGAPKLWEVDWRARWQILISRQQYPPQPFPHPPQQEDSPVYGWSCPSTSDVSTPPAQEEELGPFMWQGTDDTPTLVPFESPSTQDAGADVHSPMTVQGWRVAQLEDATTPAVRLPARTTAGLRSLAEELADVVAAGQDGGGAECECEEPPPRPASPRFFFQDLEDDEVDEDEADGDLGVRIRPALGARGLDGLVGMSVRPVSC
ncbi:hypothetical protein TRAPUB_9607 [Trametes pubescens]|uniref:Uncharacterized protein n=1 Tax=Trametes pubescens TaxID=154538 RepID=A0A1M2W1V3_TRAPU|nr:hypothetical protein TRAPUB_9607 [Trametes pubescens]